MPRDSTTGCTLCDFGRRPCVSPQACTNPHVFSQDESMATLAWKAVVFVVAITALGFFISRAL